MFSGGALERLSIFAMGVMPYISASIILQMMSMVVPSLMELRKEGESGRRKITRVHALLHRGARPRSSRFAAAVALQNERHGARTPGFSWLFTATVTLTTGTMFLMWLGEQITERGIGNGISMIILAGIVAGLPGAVGSTVEQVSSGRDAAARSRSCCCSSSCCGHRRSACSSSARQRRIPVNYAKRQVGRRMYAGQTSHLPFKLNMSGVIPPIFASSLLLFPATHRRLLRHGPRAAWRRAAEHRRGARLRASRCTC